MSEGLIKPRFHERLLTSVGLSAWFALIYTATNYLTVHRVDVGTAAFSWERWIPFVPIFIIPYWSIDLFFICAPFVLSSREELKVFRLRILAAITISGIFFLIFPLRLAFVRPEVPGLLGILFSSLDQMYNFHNLAPSLHLVLRAILWTVYIPRSRGIVRVLLAIWFFLIGISTVLCWQHQVVDVFTGQLLGVSIIHLLPESNKYPGNLAKKVNSNWNIACIYFAGSLFFVLLVCVLPLWGIIFLWPAASLLVVAGAYAGLGPAAFRKMDGKLHVQTRKLLAPFYLGLWLSFRYFTRKAPPLSEILPSLYIGKALAENEIGLLQERQIVHILDLNAEWTEPNSMRQLEYRNVPILDLTLPSPAQLELANEWLTKWRHLGASYIHCSLGLSRAGMVVLYHLVRSERVGTFEEGLALLRSKRPGVVLSDAKLEYLRTLLAENNQGKIAP